MFPILYTRNSSNTENKVYNAENAFQKIGIDWCHRKIIMRRLVERRIIKENSVNKTRASPFYERRKRRAHALISYGIEVVNFN